MTQIHEAAPTNTAEILTRVSNAAAGRARSDRAFRRQLFVDPAAALTDLTGSPVPRGTTIDVVESAAAATFVLPAFVGERAELTERQLEAVAGGGLEWPLEIAVWAVSTAFRVVIEGAEYVTR